MNHDRIDELLALAALGELDAEESAELDRALAADAELANELDLDLAVAAELQSPLAETPPPSLKADVMAAIDGVEQEPGPGSIPAPLPPPDVNAEPVVVAPVPISSARSRRFTGQMFAAAAAVAVLLIGGLAVILRPSSTLSDVDVVASADDAIERPLSDGEIAGFSVVFSPSEDAFVLVGADIPSLTDAETYQLWLVGPDGAESVGLFAPDDDGDVSERFDGRDPSDFIVGVTIEPAGGSETPTEPIRAATSA